MFFIFFLFYMQLSHLYFYYITILQIKCFTYKYNNFSTLACPGGAKRRFWGVILITLIINKVN